MTTTKVVCAECGQTAFADVLKHWEGKDVCHSCYEKMFASKYSWGNDNLAIHMKIGSRYTDYDEVYVPLLDNLLYEMIDSDDYPDLFDDYNILKHKWEGQKWGYEGDVELLGIVNIKDIHPDVDVSKVIMDAELDNLQIYEDLAIDGGLYDRPFDDEPNDMRFVSNFSLDCMQGGVYSKDFRYTMCDSCYRYVCEQNPSNGWHSQMHWDEKGTECNKCFEERVLRDGINEDWDGETIPGQFFNYKDIEEAGWVEVDSSVLVGSGYSGSADPAPTLAAIQKLIDDGNKVLINYGSMAIGGLGGYIDIYVKPNN